MTENIADKFIKLDQVSKNLELLINAEDSKRSMFFPTSNFDPSHLTECPRRIIYRVNNITPDFYRESYLDMMSGLFGKKKWIDMMEKFKNLKIVDKNVVAADCHYNISGNIDVILNIEEKIYVTKIQCIDQNQFDQIVMKGAIKKHVIEIIVYLWLTEINDGILLYDNQNTNQYKIFHIKAYSPIIKSITKKCLRLIDFKMNGKIPERPYESSGSSECSQCEFFKTCWKENNT